ncbi:hypothetical protein ACLBXM_13670 [Xanthobacteraceae bacterium A53D]
MSDHITPDLSYQRSQHDVIWDFIIGGSPQQGGRLHFEMDEFRDFLAAHFTLTSWFYMGPDATPFPQHAFQMLHAHPNHLKLPAPYPLEIEIDGHAYDNRSSIEFETATPRFVLGFLRQFQRRFPANTHLVTIIHTLTYARFDPSLPDEEALNRMLSDDEALMREMGAIE